MIPEKLKTISSKRYPVPVLEKAARVLAAFSLTERVVFFALALVFAISSFVLIIELNNALTFPVPARGGSIIEGIVGVPRFINPLLAISDADRDLTSLVYSGLMKISSSGELIPDLAASYSISDNQLEYTFLIKEDAVFHDDTPITADDILFTIRKAQDPNLKSPRRAAWEGITVEKIDDRTVKIILKQPYAPFLENTTMGILPSHIWKNVAVEQFTFSQFNIEPVGSGAYRIQDIKRSSGGIPVSYTLVPFAYYTLGKANISTLVLKFYGSEDTLVDAYEQREIESMNSVSPYRALALKALGARIENSPLPRIFAIFFNQNKASVFTYPEVRSALSKTIDRARIVSEVLSGYGIPIYGPLPQNLFGSIAIPSENATDYNGQLAEAKALLQKNGWKASATDGVFEKKVKKETIRLEFTISTSNAPELKAAAKIVKENWEAIGAKITLNFFDTGDLNQNVIRPRSYDALFFGEVIGRDLDLFAFWHSSQRHDPGLNVALYTNLKADKTLEAARINPDMTKRIESYKIFADEIANDMPAAFVYSPEFIYVVPKKLKGVSTEAITIPSDRFLTSNEWYIETDRVWKIFAPETALDRS